jgi:hypothetical protein
VQPTGSGGIRQSFCQLTAKNGTTTPNPRVVRG